ncbi:MAG TPA: hypothetical protein VF701_15010, partial [Thermoanaerobaculia bacterium]
MSRERLFQHLKVGLISAVAILLVGALVTRPVAETQIALFFAVLVLIATFLRIDAGDGSIGFEAAVVFGALVIFHSPSIALVSVAVGAGAFALYQAAVSRSWQVEPFYNVAQLALSYLIVGALYAVAVAGDAQPAAKMAGFTLLLVGYVGVHLLFVATRRYFEEEAIPID